MKRTLLFISIILSLFSLAPEAEAQSNQTIANGAATTAVNFAGAGCTYSWTNSNPAIGLPASGTGNIPSFTAVNNGNTPVTASISAKPSLSGVAYIGNVDASSVLAIDISTNKIIATIPVGNEPWGVAVSADGSRAYTTNYNDNTVSEINTATNKVIATIPVGINPTGLVVSPDGSKVYVANTNSTTSASISVINTADNTVSSIVAGTTPVGIAISADGSLLYVGDEQTATLYIINTSTKQIVNTSFTGSGPYGVALNPAGTFVYTANFASGTVSVINAVTGQFVTNINVGSNPIGIVVSPDGNTVYVADTGVGSNASVISTASNTVIANIATGHPSAGLSLNPDGSELFIADENTTFLTVVNTATNTVSADINTGISAISMGNFITGGSDCAAAKFTITVNPAALTPPTITTGAATGTISACVGTASASPDIQQFTFSGSGLKGNVTVSAPANFEISFFPNTGYGQNCVAGIVNNAIANTVIYVRSAASTPVGKLFGAVTLSSTGAVTQNVQVTAMINALPAVNTISPQTFTSGVATPPINFSGTANTFNWTNDTPAIGLASSGTGNIPSFIPLNTGSSPVIATVMVTPQTASLAYVPNELSDNVSVINTLTNAVVATIPVGWAPVGVSVSPAGDRVYITNSNDNTVSVINTATNKVIATVNVGILPWGVVVSPDGNTVYVVNHNANTVSVIDVASYTVKATVNVGAIPQGIAVNPDGREVYVTNIGDGTVSVINTISNTVTATITVGLSPNGITVSSDGSRIYVANESLNNTSNNGSVTVIDAASNTVITTITVDATATGIVLSTDGSKLYTTNNVSAEVTVINTATNAVIKTIPVGSSPFGVSINSDGSELFISNQGSNSVSVISTATNAVVATVGVGYSPLSLGNFITPSIGCSGQPAIFTITVNPTGATPLITASAVTGTISACVGTASASPNIQQFTVSGTGLTGNITATAPDNFEISLAAVSGYGNSVVLTPAAGNVSSQVIYVRSAASTPVGKLFGAVTLSSTGAVTQNVQVTAMINALPAVNTISPQTFTSGVATPPINFSGTANTFNWTNDTPAIGLAASGTGNIPSFIPVNTGSSPVTATVMVTPQTASLAYVPNEQSNNVSVINTLTNAVMATIPVGQAPAGVSVSPSGDRVYVTNTNDNTVSVINTATNKVIATVNVGILPWGVVVSPDGNTVYVVNNNANSVSVIDAASYTVKATVKVGAIPRGIAINPDGLEVYVTNASDGTVSVINTASNAVVATITVGQTPNGITTSSDGSRIYVANEFFDNTFKNGSVTTIDAASNTVISTVKVGVGASGIVLGTDGSKVYVTNNVSSVVTVINTATNAVLTTIPVGSSPFGISINTDGSELFTSNQGSNNVSVISTATNAVVATVSIGTDPIALGNFITPGMGCSGQPAIFTITVNPTGATPVITASAVTGSISACSGNASTSPDIQQFTVSGSNLTGNITLTAPANFELSLNPASGYAASGSLAPLSGTLSSTVIYVRSAASAPAGSISGNITITTPGGADKSVAVLGIVNASLTVNQPSNQVLTTGSVAAGTIFSGTASAFDWVNDTPAIGLAANGTGNIPSFTAVNNTGSPITATVTVYLKISGFAYAANSGDQTVSVINTGTNSVVATIKVGNYALGVSVSPDGSRVYVSNGNDNTVSVINTATNKVVATVNVGAQPLGLVVSPDGSKVYVADCIANTISVINTATNKVTGTITAGLAPYGIAISPDGSKLYVTNLNAKSVSVINTADGSTIATVGVGQNPIGVTVSPDGGTIYVANSLDNNISVISTATNSVVATVQVAGAPVGIVITPDGSHVYVANQGASAVSVISTASNTVTANLQGIIAPFGISVTADGSMIYVTNANAISIISTVTNAIVATIPVGMSPGSLGNFVYSAKGCIGTPTTFTITVNPQAPPTITAGTATGNISACTGAASASPQIQQFTVSGTSLSNNITATAPANFEVSLNAGSGFGNSVTIGQSGGFVNNTIVYVRSAATAPTGSISGSVALTSAGAPSQNVAVRGFVNGLPTADPVASQTLTTGSTTTAINFTGTGNTFNWVNNTPAIGLAASGTSDITSFTAINNGTSPVKATVTVTPSADGFAYVPNNGAASLSVINLSTNAIAATIQLQASPIGVAISPDGTRVYVSDQGAGNISVINTSTNKVINETILGTTEQPAGVVLSPDGSHLYVADYGTGKCSVISTAANGTSNVIYVGNHPYGIAISPNGNFVYVANTSDNTVSVINTASNTVQATIQVGTNPADVVVSPDGSRIYTVNHDANTVSVIDGATNAVIATIAVGAGPTELAIGPDGNRIYVANISSSTVSVIDASANNVIANVPVGISPAGISVTADGSLVYVTNSGEQSVSVINTASNTVTSTINGLGASPFALGNFIYNGSGCSGVPVSFNITVNPTAVNGIVASAAKGNMSTCQGTAAASPLIQRFSVSGGRLSAGITVTSPANFEVSLNIASGYASSVVIPQNGGNVNSTVVFVRLAASAPVGNLSGNLILSSTGFANQNVAVQGTVNVLPSANTVKNQVLNNGAATTAVAFSGTGNAFTWVNDTPGIGLPASGTGDIVSFTATNNSNVPVKATITATPVNGGFAYITNSQNGLNVVNTVSYKNVATLPVGASPSYVTVNPDGSKAYVINQGSNFMTEINTVTNTVAANITIGTSAFAVVVSPDGSRLYVTYAASGATVTVVDAATNKVIANIDNLGEPSYFDVLSPDGSRLYVADVDDNNVAVINTATNTVISRMNVVNASFLTISPDGSLLYVGDSYDQTITVVNTATNNIMQTFHLVSAPQFAALSSDGSQLYLSNALDNTVSVVNTTNGALIATIPVGQKPLGLSVSADGSHLYVTNEITNNVSVINTATDKVEATFPVGFEPYSFGNFLKQGTGCAGSPVTFTITVNPTGTVSGITAGAATGAISACEGTAAASPDIQQFTVSGNGLSADITASAPPGFEVSLTAGSGYGGSVILTQSAGSVNGVVYVRSAANAGVGAISGNVVLTTAGSSSQNVAVNGIVNPLPTINSGFAQNIITGTPTTAINFTGTGNVFDWTNDTPSIGLAASGTGNISTFIGVNNSSSPVTATITAIPQSVSYAYVPNQNDKTVSVINTTTNAVERTIAVGQTPTGVAVSSDGSRVYITNQQDKTISVISTSTNTVLNTIVLNSYGPTGICVSPDGKSLYAVDINSNSLSVISTTTYATTNTIPVGGYPLCVAVSPDGKTLYVTNSSNSVSVINSVSGKVIYVDMPKGPYGVALSPDGTKVYVVSSGANVLSVIDAATNRIVSSIPVGANPVGVTASPDGTTVYVTNKDANTVSVVNTITKAVTTVAVGASPSGISVSTDGSRVYVANQAANNVSVIDAANNTVLTTVAVGSGPNAIGNFVTPGTGCSGIPVKFSITVSPRGTIIPPSIIATGSLPPLSTTYGTPSSSATFTVSGTNMTAGILVTPPPGFEVSGDGLNYGGTVLVSGSGTIATVTVYIRLAAITQVGKYSGNVVLTSAGAANVDVATALSTVIAAPLTISADNKSKTYGAENPLLTITYNGFVNGEGPSQLTTQPTITTTATIFSVAGTYPIIPAGAIDANYTFTYINGVLTIVPAELPQLVVPNTFTPNGDRINDTWDIKNIEYYPNCTVQVYNRWGEKLYSSIGYPIPWDGRYKGALLPTGTYYYIINLKDNRTVHSGWVAIIK